MVQEEKINLSASSLPPDLLSFHFKGQTGSGGGGGVVPALRASHFGSNSVRFLSGVFKYFSVHSVILFVCRDYFSSCHHTYISGQPGRYHI